MEAIKFNHKKYSMQFREIWFRIEEEDSRPSQSARRQAGGRRKQRGRKWRVPGRGAFLPVNVEGVAQSLKRIRNCVHGEDDVQRRPVGLEPGRSEKGLKAFGEKAHILESAEYP